MVRALTHEDVEAHNAGEDEHTVRWLTGDYGTVESTTTHFDRLADNARAGCGKRGFGVCLDGRLAGYVDCDPDVGDGLEPGDVNISYAVHPWASRFRPGACGKPLGRAGDRRCPPRTLADPDVLKLRDACGALTVTELNALGRNGTARAGLPRPGRRVLRHSPTMPRYPRREFSQPVVARGCRHMTGRRPRYSLESVPRRCWGRGLQTGANSHSFGPVS
jgi:hypothetical protein